MTQFRMNIARLGLMGAVILAFATTMPSASAEEQGLQAAGDRRAVWIIRAEPGRERFNVLYQPGGELLFQPRQAKKPTGRLARDGVAAAGDHLWIFYGDVDAHAQLISATHNEMTGEHEFRADYIQSPPKGAMIRNVAAANDRPWALVRIETLDVLKSIDALPLSPRSDESVDGDAGSQDPASQDPASQGATKSDDAAKPDDAGDATTQDNTTGGDASTGDAGSDTPAEAADDSAASASTKDAAPTDDAARLPRDRMIYLRDGAWHRCPLPEDWPHAIKQTWLISIDDASTTPVLIAREPAREGQPSTLLVYTAQGEQPQNPQWQRQTYRLAVDVPINARISFHTIEGQLAMARFVADDAEPSVVISALRSDLDDKPLPIGTFKIKTGEEITGATTVSLGDSIGLLFADSKERLFIARMNHLGEVIGPEPVEMYRHNPFDQSAGRIVLVAVIMLATIIMLSFWRKEAQRDPNLLPEEVKPADFTSRILAGVLDLFPCVFIASVLTNTSLSQMIANHPIGAETWDQMMPFVLALALYLVYSILTEGLAGKTLGMVMFKLDLIKPDGSHPEFSRVLKRNMGKAVDLVGFFLLPIAFANPMRQRLGDMMGGVVIVTPRHPDDEAATPSDDE